jgi:hypothetical protein
VRGVHEVLRLNYLVGFVNIVLESRCVAIHVYSSTRDDMYVDAVTHSPLYASTKWKKTQTMRNRNASTSFGAVQEWITGSQHKFTSRNGGRRPYTQSRRQLCRQHNLLLTCAKGCGVPQLHISLPVVVVVLLYPVVHTRFS